MRDKLKKVLWVLFIGHLVVGLGIIVVLVFSAPMVIGAGQLEQLVNSIEIFDFKWYVVGVAVALFSMPIAGAVLYAGIRAARLEVDRLQQILYRALDHAVPLEVDVDDRVPVHFDEKIEVPIELSTKLDFDDEIDLEAEIPVDTELPIDTEIETRVLGIGSIKIPIRATIPLKVSLPVRNRVRVKAHQVPIHLLEKAWVTMPPFELPLRARLETKINLLSNLRYAERLLNTGTKWFGSDVTTLTSEE